eukprot:9161883-Alexandrium_andersonii.AAC.1
MVTRGRTIAAPAVCIPTVVGSPLQPSTACPCVRSVARSTAALPSALGLLPSCTTHCASPSEV